MGRKVQANYQDLAQSANQFAQESSQIQELFQRINQCLGTLQGGAWVGRGANAYYSEMQELLLPAVQRLIQGLQDASSTIKRVSDAIAEAENQAAGLFRRG